MEQPTAEPQQGASPPGRTKAARRFSLALLALGASALLALVGHVEFLVDDAFISLRFARNWVELGTPVFNSFELGPGGQPVEGFSNLLWTALLAVLYWAGAPFPELLGPVQLSMAMGVLIVQLRFVTNELRLGRVGEFASVALLATSAPFVAWASGGMETTLFTLLLTSFLVGLLRRELRRPSDLASLALTAAAVCAVRVEGILWVLGAAAAVITAESMFSGEGLGALRRHRQRLLWVAVAAAFAVAAQLLWRQATFGEWLPNTVAAKTGGGAEVMGRGLRQVATWALVSVTPIAALAMTLPALRHPSGRARVAAGASLFLALGFVAYNALVGGDWMPFFRFLAPCTPALALLAAVGIDRAPRGAGIALALGLAVAQPLPLFDLHIAPEGLRSALRFRSFKGGYRTEAQRIEVARENEGNFTLLGKALAAEIRPGDVLAFGPIGSPGWVAPSLDFVDRNGLVTPSVARREVKSGGTAGHEKRVPHAWFLDHGTPAPNLLYATWRPGAVRGDQPGQLRALKRALQTQGQTSRPEERPLFEGTRLRLHSVPTAGLGDPSREFSELTLILFERADPATARASWGQ
jgi:hypothetical protein